ncbi:MAG: molybdenum cofactor guanylyltransferase [Geodermatophilaceae bacterium]|nr:molybdenum cofactor guanylyltransferase [Geodermatophilaceae bacterium]
MPSGYAAGTASLLHCVSTYLRSGLGVTPPYGAIVLAGGRARRLAGRSKPELRLGGRRLLDLVLDAVPDADPRIVVGPEMDLPPNLQRVREEPAGGGPVAGLAAGLAVLGQDVEMVAVLAADLPFLTRPVISALSERVADGAVLVDDSGRDQLLIGVWRVGALRLAVAALPGVDGASLRALVARLDVARVSWDVPAGTPPPWWDCDSAEDLRQAKEWL